MPTWPRCAHEPGGLAWHPESAMVCFWAARKLPFALDERDAEISDLMQEAWKALLTYTLPADVPPCDSGGHLRRRARGAVLDYLRAQLSDRRRRVAGFEPDAWPDTMRQAQALEALRRMDTLPPQIRLAADILADTGSGDLVGQALGVGETRVATIKRRLKDYFARYV